MFKIIESYKYRVINNYLDKGGSEFDSVRFFISLLTQLIHVKELRVSLESNFKAKMVFTSQHKRFIIEYYFHSSAFNHEDFFLTGIRV
jgi:hypothetical protein